MAKPPKKSTGWKYSAVKVESDGCRPWFDVDGPVSGWVHCETMEMAETVAAALNLAAAQRSITLKANRLAEDLADIASLFRD